MSKVKFIQGQLDQLLCSFCVLVMAMLFTGAPQSTFVEAIDIIGFDNPNACSGSGFSFAGIGSQVCAEFRYQGSFLISGLSGAQTGVVYNGGGCNYEVLSEVGPDDWCFYGGGGYTGAAWFNEVLAESSPMAEGASRCSSTMAPDGVIFTNDMSKGAWVLKASNARDVMAQLKSVDDDKKVSWLQAHGAHFEAGSTVNTISHN